MTADSKSNDVTPQLNSNRQPQEVPELVVPVPDEKNWRGIGIALLVIVLVCALIVTAVVLLTPGDKGIHSGKKRVSIEEVLMGVYSPRTFNGTWFSDHEFLYRDDYDNILMYNVHNNTRQSLMSNTTFRQHKGVLFSLSPDRQYFLIARDYSNVFRYTYRASFLLYNISSDYMSPLFPEAPDMKLQYASWGPTGSQLVYVLYNDVYYMESVHSEPKRLTSTGLDDVIYNGVPDWLYEEEVLSNSHALWWSEDGKQLAFATFNDTKVEEMKYPYYGSYKDVKNVYTEMISLRYPKPGTPNPTVKIWVADLLDTSQIRQVQPPKEYEDLDYYFTTVQWADNGSLAVTWLKRSQDHAIISICKESDGWLCKTNHEEDTKGQGWVELYDGLKFTDDKQYYFVILPGPPEGSAGRFKHLAMVNVKTGKLDFLTKGRYVVTEILEHRAKDKTVYYISTLEDKPGERHLFGVTDITHPSPGQTFCITCDVNPDCLYNSARFAPKSPYYILKCLGPGVPQIELRSTEDKALKTVLDTNDNLKELLTKRSLPTIKQLQVPIPGTTYNAQVMLLLPPGLREDEITKYPLMLQVYAGPNSQLVQESFAINWGTYLASKRNIIFAMIDGRGSDYKGNKMLHEVYRKLGTVEVQDQITITKYLRDTLPYVDETKISVFGWSYGGYVSAMILSSDEGVFKCGISVAPVTSWRYYDSAYTERFMQFPTASDNLANYEKSEVMKRVENFKGKKYLLVHGLADDNVHWQQSAMLSKSLTDAGIIFRMQVYPDERHGLSNVKMHLYQTVDNFLDHCYTEEISSSTSTSDSNSGGSNNIIS